MSKIIKIIIMLAIILIIIYLVALFAMENQEHKDLPGINNVLLVIAHPDDESMFFLPTLTNLVNLDKKIFILCLSNGDDENMGWKREDELYFSSKRIGITRDQIRISNFKDGPKEIWKPRDVAEDVNKSVWEWKIDSIITFDKVGVSGHPNHRACYFGVRYYLKDGPDIGVSNGIKFGNKGGSDKVEIGPNSKDKPQNNESSRARINDQKSKHNPNEDGSDNPRRESKSNENKLKRPYNIKGYALRSFRNFYTGPVRTNDPNDRLPTSLFFISKRVDKAWKTMSEHKSQFKWYRKLSIVMSQYSFFNELCLIV